MSRNGNTQNLTGKRFGKLTVLSQSVELFHGKRQSVCRCLCDCGNECSVPAYRLSRMDGTPPKQPTHSCGCTKDHGDLTGKRFGRLAILSETERSPSGDRQWLCRCDCGEQTLATSYQLVKRDKYSCGCALREHQKRFYQYGVTAASVSHSPEAEKKRTATAFGSKGSPARQRKGEQLRDALETTGAMESGAFIAKIADTKPQGENPYRGVCWNSKKQRWMAYCRVAGHIWRRCSFRTAAEAKAARDEMQQKLLNAYQLTESVERYKEKRGKRCGTDE